MTEIDEFLRKKNIEADISRLSILHNNNVYLHDINFLKFLNNNKYTKNKYKKPIVLSYDNLVELLRLNVITTIRNGGFSIEYIYQKLLNNSLNHMSQIKNYYKTYVVVVDDTDDKENKKKVLVNIFDTSSPCDLTLDDYDLLKRTKYKPRRAIKHIIYRNNKTSVPLITTYGLQENLNYYQSNKQYLIGKIYNSSDGVVKLPRIPRGDKCIIEFKATNIHLNKYTSEFKIISNKNQYIKHVMYNNQLIKYDGNKKLNCDDIIVKNLNIGDKVVCYLKKETDNIFYCIIIVKQLKNRNPKNIEVITNTNETQLVSFSKKTKYLNLHSLLKIGYIAHSLIKEEKKFFIYYPPQKTNKQIYYNIKLVLPTTAKKSETLIFRFADISGLKGNKCLELEFEKNTVEPDIKHKNSLIIYSKSKIQYEKEIKRVKLPLNQFRRGDYIKLICKKDNIDIYKDGKDKKVLEFNKINQNQTTWICIIKKRIELNERFIFNEKKDISKNIIVDNLIKKTIILSSDTTRKIFRELSHSDNIYSISESDNNSILYVKSDNFSLDLSELEYETVYKVKICFKNKGMNLNIIDSDYKIINHLTKGSNLTINSTSKNQIVSLYYNKKNNRLLII